MIISFLKNLEKYTIVGEKESKKADQSTPHFSKLFLKQKEQKGCRYPEEDRDQACCRVIYSQKVKDNSGRMEKKRAVTGWIIIVLPGFEKFKGETGMHTFIMMKNSFSQVKQSY